MSTRRTVEEMLTDVLEAKHVKAAVRHFDELVTEFQLGKWEKSIAKGGKFIEAILKAVWVKAGETVPSGKAFKADTIMNQLPHKTSLVDDSVRVTLPRVCRVIYDIASNRGGRHDPDEVDPNVMDATVVLANAQWILAELVRYSQKGATNADEAADQVDSLIKRRYPFFEDIDGHLYSDIGKSARQVGLMILFYHAKRMTRLELRESIVRHGYTEANANDAIKRLAGAMDDDGSGNVKLRLTGIREAEKLIEKHRPL
jgi:hypothetical protein